MLDLKALNESFNRINLIKTSGKLFEDFCEDCSESGIEKEDILDWLSEHEQLWKDCEKHFVQDPTWLSADELEGFICEHEQACKDYAKAFSLSLNESLKESRKRRNGRLREALGGKTIFIDVSGGYDDDDTRLSLRHAHTHFGKDVDVYYFAQKVGKTPQGLGHGTDVSSVIKFIKKEGLRPEDVVVYTDEDITYGDYYFGNLYDYVDTIINPTKFRSIDARNNQRRRRNYAPLTTSDRGNELYKRSSRYHESLSQDLSDKHEMEHESEEDLEEGKSFDFDKLNKKLHGNIKLESTSKKLKENYYELGFSYEDPKKTELASYFNDLIYDALGDCFILAAAHIDGLPEPAELDSTSRSEKCISDLVKALVDEYYGKKY